MTESREDLSNSSSPKPRWAQRHPTLVAISSATALFSLIQAAFVLVREEPLAMEVTHAMTVLSLIVGALTVLLTVPLILILRRWHPRWRQDDRAGATRSLLFGFVAAVTTWMLADAWLTGPLVPSMIRPWIPLALALVAGVVVARHPPAERFTVRTALLLIAVPLLVAIAVQDIGGRPAVVVLGESASLEQALPAGAPDVVLASIDTLRLDRLGAYGSTPSLTPEIDRIAEEGYVFERVLAASPWTVPSVASMLTGLPTIRHGAGLPLSSGPTFLRSPLAGNVATLAERFSAAGYRTHAIVANGFLSPGSGMERGFDNFQTPLNQAMGAIFVQDMPLFRLVLALFPVENWGDYRAQGLTDSALRVLAEDNQAPLFLWVHFIDPHIPYQADPSHLDLKAWSAEVHSRQPEVLDDGTVVGEVFAGASNVRSGALWLGPEDRRRIVSYYDRTVGYVDTHVGRLFDALRERSAERPTVAILTADHGEEFWDHEHFEHGHDYYREITSIPLIAWGPELVSPGRAEVGPVGLVDVAPTLLDLAGLQVPQPEAPDEGRSLVPLVRQASERTADPTAETLSSYEEEWVRFAGGTLYGLPAVLLETHEWRFILRANGVEELYAVNADPLERHNRAMDHPELVQRYRALLEPRLAVFLENRADAARELDPDTLKALQALGYLQ